MTAAEQQKAEAAALRRLEDVQERVVEAIGDLLARRASRKAHLNDSLDSLRITREDLFKLGDIVAKFAEDDEDAPDYQTAFDQSYTMKDIKTVADLAAAIVQQCYPQAGGAP